MQVVEAKCELIVDQYPFVGDTVNITSINLTGHGGFDVILEDHLVINGVRYEVSLQHRDERAYVAQD